MKRAEKSKVFVLKYSMTLLLLYKVNTEKKVTVQYLGAENVYSDFLKTCQTTPGHSLV